MNDVPKQVAVDRSVTLPKSGDRIPAERFHVSKLNVRVDEPFGDSEEDKALIENARRGKLVQPFKARPEGDGYGIYVGRRRFLSKMAVGAKAFVVGQEVIIDNISDDQAREDSLVENLSVLREEMNPLLRARKIQDLIDFNMIGLRAVARKLGIAASSLSEWTKILELPPSMQQAVATGKSYYKDALTLAKLKLGEIQQEQLAQALESGGWEAYLMELDKIVTGLGKRGVPKGKYMVVRAMFMRSDSATYDGLVRLADAKSMDLDEYVKQILTEHVQKLL